MAAARASGALGASVTSGMTTLTPPEKAQLSQFLKGVEIFGTLGRERRAKVVARLERETWKEDEQCAMPP